MLGTRVEGVDDCRMGYGAGRSGKCCGSETRRVADVCMGAGVGGAEV